MNSYFPITPGSLLLLCRAILLCWKPRCPAHTDAHTCQQDPHAPLPTHKWKSFRSFIITSVCFGESPTQTLNGLSEYFFKTHSVFFPEGILTLWLGSSWFLHIITQVRETISGYFLHPCYPQYVSWSSSINITWDLEMQNPWHYLRCTESDSHCKLYPKVTRILLECSLPPFLYSFHPHWSRLRVPEIAASFILHPEPQTALWIDLRAKWVDSFYKWLLTHLYLMSTATVQSLKWLFKLWDSFDCLLLFSPIISGFGGEAASYG